MSLEIFDNTLIKLILRKGPNVDRQQVILEEGEPAYTVDTKRMYIGDGVTAGGLVAGNKFLGTGPDLTLLANVPAEPGDTAYNTSNNTIYYIQSGTGTSQSDWYSLDINIDAVEYESLKTTVQTQSGDWESTHTTVQNTSSNWSTAFTTANTLTTSVNALSTTVNNIIYPVTYKLVSWGEGNDMRDNETSKYAPFTFTLTKVFATIKTVQGSEVSFDIYKNGGAFPQAVTAYLGAADNQYTSLVLNQSISAGDELQIFAGSAAASFCDADELEIILLGYVSDTSYFDWF
jgi:hypothetical protein